MTWKKRNTKQKLYMISALFILVSASSPPPNFLENFQSSPTLSHIRGVNFYTLEINKRYMILRYPADICQILTIE